MVESAERSGRFFGRTSVEAVIGDVIEQPVEAIVYLANTRGMMEAGSATSIRLVGGKDVEREAMALAPHQLGSIFITGSGRLRSINRIEFVFHVVLSRMLGEAPRRELAPRAIDDLLTSAEQRRIRSLAIPVIGASTDASEEERQSAIDDMVEAVVSWLRRRSARIERIILVARFPDDAPLLERAIDTARRKIWAE
ncbi:MAG: macro domain-containing protein [Thermomicrobiales bacterium]|nr:macro domain-containing protein [Thermomicrobiales bacterium]